MQTNNEFTRVSRRAKIDVNDTTSIENITMDWKWLEKTLKQEDKEIKQLDEYRKRLEDSIQHAEDMEKATRDTISVIKDAYNQVLELDRVHFFNPSNFPADAALDSIINHAFSGGVRTKRALQLLGYITLNEELGDFAPGVFQKAFEAYQKSKSQEKNSWFFGLI